MLLSGNGHTKSLNKKGSQRNILFARMQYYFKKLYHIILKLYIIFAINIIIFAIIPPNKNYFNYSFKV